MPPIPNTALAHIHMQIMWSRLIAVVEEQAQTLVRTAFSTTVREAGDLSAGVFDRDGNMLDHWGEGVFKRAHGLHIGPDEMLYLTDDGDHCVRKCTPDGKILMTLGTPSKPCVTLGKGRV